MKICTQCNSEFHVSDRELAFGERFGVPPSELCPADRMRELMAFRNERKLYRRHCDSTGEPIISAYRPDSPFPIYKNEIWWGDSWEATDYGRDFDFTRPFFEQFAELQKVVPREGTSIFNSENCEYNSHTRFSRNCYLNHLSSKCEDTSYSYWVVEDKDVMDSCFTNHSTLCYQCVDVESSYGCIHLQEAKDCHDCHFSFQLQSCRHAIFSSNLVNAEYVAFNKPVSKEEFEAIKKQYLHGSYNAYLEALKKFDELKRSTIHRSNHLLNCENCLGDHLYDCRNCTLAFEGANSEDCINAVSFEGKDLVNVLSTGWPSCEVLYYSSVARGCNTIAFCSYSWFSSNLFYCDSMNASHNCFGSIGLRQKKYCILNKQYSKEEYETLLPKIIEHMSAKGGSASGGKKSGEWGKFFPPQLSPFAYNETAAMDYFPLEKDAALALGFAWTDYEQPAPEVEKSIPAGKLPDESSEVPDDVLNWALICEETKKPFRLTPYELKYYREQGLPLPRLHPEARHQQRFRSRNPQYLYERSCDQCRKSIQTTYLPSRPEKVFCEECTLKVVYS